MSIYRGDVGAIALLLLVALVIELLCYKNPKRILARGLLYLLPCHALSLLRGALTDLHVTTAITLQ